MRWRQQCDREPAHCKTAVWQRTSVLHCSEKETDLWIILRFIIGSVCCCTGSLVDMLFLTDVTGGATIWGTSSLLLETGTYFVLSLRVNVVTSLEYSCIQMTSKTITLRQCLCSEERETFISLQSDLFYAFNLHQKGKSLPTLAGYNETETWCLYARNYVYMNVLGMYRDNLLLRTWLPSIKGGSLPSPGTEYLLLLLLCEANRKLEISTTPTKTKLWESAYS